MIKPIGELWCVILWMILGENLTKFRFLAGDTVVENRKL